MVMKQIWIREEDHEKVRTKAYECRCSLVDVVTDALRQYFEDDSEKSENKG